MGNFAEFAGYAKIYSVLWFIFSLWDARKMLKSLEDRRREVENLVEGMVNLLKKMPAPVLQKLFGILWIILTVFDVLGFALLLEFIDRIDWWVKLLVIVAVLTTVNSIPQLLDNVRSMHDPDQFRSSLMKYLHPWTLRIAYTGMIIRLLAAVTLLVVVNS